MDEYNRPKVQKSQTTGSGRVLQQPAWIAKYQQNFAKMDVKSEVYFSQEKVIDPIVHYIMTQYVIGMGLRKFKKQGGMEVTQQLKQIHYLQTFIPMDADPLTEEKKATPSLMFLTRKICGTVKANECANGSKQRECIKKEGAA